MRVLLFTLEYPPFKGGVASYYGNLAEFWPEKNSLNVLDNNDGKLVSAWLFPAWLPAIWHLFRRVKKEAAEYVLVGQILPLGTAALILNLIKGTPYSVFLHGMDAALAGAKPRKKFISKIILSRARMIICPSVYTADAVNEVFGGIFEDKIRIVNPGVRADVHFKANARKQAIDGLREKYGLEGKFILLSIGRLVKRKGFDTVIKAMPQITKTVPNTVYLIAGDGPDRDYLESLAKGLPNVIFLGIIDEEMKHAFLNLCDVFIMVSRRIGDDFEGFGIVYLEASLSGKPVVAGREGGASEAVLEDETGILVDPENPEETAEAVIRLAKNPQIRYFMGTNGSRRAAEEFNWTQQSKKISILIKEK